MICPRCQTPNRASAKFCDECGYELPSVAPIAHEIFDSQDEVDNSPTFVPKAAPTADLNGIDKTNDSSFQEEVDSDITEVIEKVEEKDEADLANQPSAADDSDKTIEMELRETSSDNTAVMSRVGEDDEAGSNSDKKSYTITSSDSKKQFDPTLKRNISIAIAAIAIIAAILAGTYYAQLWGGVVVPDVMGMSEQEAVEKVKGAGFTTEIETISSDGVEGIIIGMDPSGGSRTNEGGKVKLQVSIKRVVPDIVGLSQEDAQGVMSKNGFTNVEYLKVKSDNTENTVVSVTPDVSTRARADAKITINIAEPYTVPDVAGLTKDDAQARLEAAGFVASFTTQYNETVAEGSAISSEPAKDSVAKSGSTVNVFIAEKRSTKLVQLAREFFSATSFFNINGVAYELGNVQGLQWTSGGTVAFTITARQYQSVTWFGTQTETRYGSYETIQGSISFDDNDNIIATSPSMRQGA